MAFGSTPLPLAALSRKQPCPMDVQQEDSGHDLTCTNTQGAGGGQSGDRLKARPQQSPSGEVTMAQTREDTRHGDRASGPLESHGCGYHPTSPRTWRAEMPGRWLWRPQSLHQGTVSYTLALAISLYKDSTMRCGSR